MDIEKLLKQKENELKNKIEQLENQIDGLKTKKENYAIDIVALENKKNELQKQVNKLSDTIKTEVDSALNSAREALKEKEESVSAELGRAKVEMDKTKALNDSLSKKIAEADKLKERLQADIKAQDRINGESSAIKNRLKSILESIKGALNG